MHPAPAQPQLVRAIGRWTLTALVLNSVIGSGIFGLPSVIAKHLGPAAPAAYVLGALAIGVLMAVFAEVSSQFREAGGQYLYARATLGRFAGIQIGWFFLLVRLTSGAAVINLFVNYLGEFWPRATVPGTRAMIMVALVGGFAVVNYRGVRAGAGLSNFFTVAKVATLGLFIVAGLLLVKTIAPAAPAAPVTLGAWTDALVALVFAFGGFESALIPASETKDPRRDTPFALGLGLVIIAACYLLIHVVAMRGVSDLASSARPLADAARSFAGPAGATAMALAALLSTYGWLSGAFVTMPRLIFALAERGDFPRRWAAVHARFRSPHVAIIFWAVLLLALAIYGNFIWNAILAGVARLVTYATTCVVLIRLRRTAPQADAWRAPAGPLLAVIGIVFCAVLAARMNATHLTIMGAVAVIAAVNWFAVRPRPDAAGPLQPAAPPSP
ncbi:MAG: APC family permease [Opitutaceae bacterium]|nr:APC family permease [Opitutaceae bacterium]